MSERRMFLPEHFQLWSILESSIRPGRAAVIDHFDTLSKTIQPTTTSPTNDWIELISSKVSSSRPPPPPPTTTTPSTVSDMLEGSGDTFEIDDNFNNNNEDDESFLSPNLLLPSATAIYSSSAEDANQLLSPAFLMSSSSSSSPSSSSSSSSSMNDDESILYSEQFGNIILIISYSLIVLISLFGNLFVCRVMFSLCFGPGQSNGRTTTNVLILNLAISDLLLTCFNIPINIVRFVSTNWPFGSLICTLTPFIQSLSAHCSSITMMVIAFERYRSLIGFGSGWNFCLRQCCRCCSSTGPDGTRSLGGQPTTFGGQRTGSCKFNQHQTDQSSWKRSILLIWIFSIILSIPHCLFNQVVVYPSLLAEKFDMERCATVFPNEQSRLMLAILSPLSQYLLPIGLTALFYARIGCFLWRRSDPVGNVSENRKASILKRKKKRVKMLVVVVAVFATCWFPLHLYVTLIDFQIIQHHFGIYFVTHWIAMSSVCYNPFIYCWLNETFRRRTDPLFQSLYSFKNTLQRLLRACCWSQTAEKDTTIGKANKPDAEPEEDGQNHRHQNNNSQSNSSSFGFGTKINISMRARFEKQISRSESINVDDGREPECKDRINNNEFEYVEPEINTSAVVINLDGQ